MRLGEGLEERECAHVDCELSRLGEFLDGVGDADVVGREGFEAEFC